MNSNSITEELIGIGKTGAALTRKERDKQLRKADIMRAAERVFAQKGYHNAAMQDIAREAQYATGTVYLYFKDKEALYFSLLEEKIKGLNLVLKEATGHIADAEDRLRIFIHESLSYFQRNQDFFKIFFSERTKGQLVKDAKFSKSPIMAQNKELVLKIIRSGQEQKVVRNDFEAAQISDILGSIFMNVVFDLFKDAPRDESKLKEMSGFILDIFLNGAGKKR
ncbi:MAG: TetR/AcrR family transcriptional regulator [Candidatus Omnitrophica bacterium]|nr:TetR/AcrR family transcriptional regulator [Candidatus Omnitrophota bacterium]